MFFIDPFFYGLVRLPSQLFFGFIGAFLFAIPSENFMYDPPRFRFILLLL